MSVIGNFKTLDIDQENSSIYLGTTSDRRLHSDKMDALRATIIDFHFTTARPYTLDLWGRRFIPRTPLSTREIVPLSLKAFFQKLKIKDSILIVMSCFAVLALALFIRRILEKCSVLRVDESKNFSNGMEFLGPLLFGSLSAYFGLKFKKVFNEVSRANQDRFLVFQELVQKPHNQHLREKNDWRDPISLEDIPSEKIFTPQILNIGPYVMTIQNALHAMFTRVHCKNGEIPHPIEMRPLSPEEQGKFLEDICTFFCIADRQQLLDVWDTEEETIADLELEEGISEVERTVAVKKMTPAERVLKFIELLPEKTFETYFKNYIQSFLPEST